MHCTLFHSVFSYISRHQMISWCPLYIKITERKKLDDILSIHFPRKCRLFDFFERTRLYTSIDSLWKGYEREEDNIRFGSKSYIGLKSRFYVHWQLFSKPVYQLYFFYLSYILLLTSQHMCVDILLLYIRILLNIFSYNLMENN